MSVASGESPKGTFLRKLDQKSAKIPETWGFFSHKPFLGFSRNLRSWTWWVVEKSRFTLPKCARYTMRTFISLMKILTNLNCFPPFPGFKKKTWWRHQPNKLHPKPPLHHNQTTTPSTTGICGAKWHTELYPSDDQRHGHLGFQCRENSAGFPNRPDTLKGGGGFEKTFPNGPLKKQNGSLWGGCIWCNNLLETLVFTGGADFFKIRVREVEKEWKRCTG